MSIFLGLLQIENKNKKIFFKIRAKTTGYATHLRT